MERSFLANIMILFGIGISSILEQQPNQIGILIDDGNVKGSASIHIPTVHLSFFV